MKVALQNPIPIGGGISARRLPWFALASAYEIRFWVRGETLPNTLEVKFVDASGDNVHSRQTTHYAFPDGWTLVRLRSAR